MKLRWWWTVNDLGTPPGIGLTPDTVTLPRGWITPEPEMWVLGLPGIIGTTNVPSIVPATAERRSARLQVLESRY